MTFAKLADHLTLYFIFGTGDHFKLYKKCFDEFFEFKPISDFPDYLKNPDHIKIHDTENFLSLAYNYWSKCRGSYEREHACALKILTDCCVKKNKPEAGMTEEDK